MNLDKAPSSVSITIPAYNEEGAIRETIKTVVDILSQTRNDYEIFVFNDCSRDQTGQIADECASTNPQIKVFHNEVNRGIGYAYRKGAELATKNNYILIHGDNEIGADLIKKIFEASGQGDFIMTHIEKDNRSLGRRLLSRAFTLLVNGLFGLNVRYFNGPTMIPVKLLKEVPMNTNSFAFMAEIVVTLCRRGYKPISIGFESKVRDHGKSQALKLKNVVGVLKTLYNLKFRKLAS